MHKFEDIEAEALLIFGGEEGMTLAIPPHGDDEEVPEGVFSAAALMAYMGTHEGEMQRILDWFHESLKEQKETDGEEQADS